MSEKRIKKGFKTETYGVDLDNNDVKAVEKETPKWISKTKIRFPSGKIVSIDPNEASFEVYNPNKFRIVMQNCHTDPIEREINKLIIIEPDGFNFIPHRYYIPWVDKVGTNIGQQFQIVENFGDNMFIGNKKLSRPTKKKTQVFQK